jgi:hypothetical protein
VTGAVATPGALVELPAGSRAQDAIEAAGGALETADLQRVNLAQLLSDGAQVNVPLVGEVVAEVTEQATPEESIPLTTAIVEHLESSLPAQINADTRVWRRDSSTAPIYANREGGRTVLLSYTSSGGELMELTFGAFDTPEQAMAYWETVRGQLSNLGAIEERSEFTTPNAFGSGTYGSSAIFVRDTSFIRISVPRFSGTFGDPINPMARQVFTLLDDALATLEQ